MQLNYKKLGDTGTTIIILHGLLGALDNWQTIAKQLSQNHQVYIIDQRNHGRSPHTNDMSYELLAQDVHDFFIQHSIQHASIIGHSMGGKAAMLFALQYPDLVEKLIIVDIAPTLYDGGHEAILFAMAEAPIKSTNDRNEIDVFLQPRIHDFGTRQFILKNLSRNNLGKFEWKSNLEVLIKSYRLLMEFPAINTKYLKPVYFIKGEKSNYINQDNFEALDNYFPNNKIIEIKNAGHWVHADNPVDFYNTIQTILK